MKDVVLISTHDLEIAGALREALGGAGLDPRLVVSADDVTEEQDAALLILSGKVDEVSAEEMAEAGREGPHVPVFGVFPHSASGVRERAQDLGLEEYFTTPLDLDGIVLLSKRAVARRHLQKVTRILGESDAIRQALERVLQIAHVDSTVLITGESGTGKELVARGIHALSRRRHTPFIAVNVAALSETLLESELFGHAKGAFTGAIDSRKGMFELADGGAIFLDEMGEMPLTTQTKLLRVLETREFLRVGGETPVHVDLRVIAATNQDLHHRVAIGEFRRDLYHRLNVLHIELPPLRDRRSDIPILVDHFIDEVSRTHGLDFVGISDEAMDILEAYDWPGNVRELRNLVESMVVLAPGGEVRAEDIPLEVRNPVSRARNVPMVRSRGLPVPVGSGAPDAVGRTELEFIFRTLVDMRMDMDQLRQEFERYQQEHAGESGELGVSPRSMHPARRPLDLSTLREGLGDEGLKAGEIATGPLTDSDDEGIEDVTEVEVVSSDQPSSLALPDGAILFRPGMTMEELEKQAVASALAQTGGNRRKAAELLGIGERTLYRKITRFGLED